ADYPALFLKCNDRNGMLSVFPKLPLEFGEDGDRSLKILKEANYIAKTNGQRCFPWRYFVITKDDGQLIENTMTYKLADKNVLEDTSWIKPGLASWEWWNGATPYGQDVDFVAGCNLDTYKYFIDFAAHYGIPYIIMDEGWAKSTRDPYTPNPKVDLHELIRYGKEKNVGIVLWLTWLAVENNFDLFETFEKWGVKGIKIDFMDRSDQWMMNYYERVAKEAAKHHLFIDFHGSFKPSGLEYKYPNVLSYEGVRGMEQMGGCRPDNSVYFPFIRNAVGPMDYTPGIFDTKLSFLSGDHSFVRTTLAKQLALYVTMYSPLQMAADLPESYERHMDAFQFIKDVAVDWDDNKYLEAEPGDYITVARKAKGTDNWFEGGITDENPRTSAFTLDFLEPGKQYVATLYADGKEADFEKNPTSYQIKKGLVTNKNKMSVKLARSGGFAVSLIEATPADLKTIKKWK
ncbi:glycoside hydrolase family 97 protein, partial [Bacteroides ovatus]